MFEKQRLALLGVRTWIPREDVFVSLEVPLLTTKKTWQDLQREVSQCEQCRLHQTRKNTVFGVGDQSAQLMLIGEAPGRDEDLSGEPFVGRAGQLLNEIIKAMGYHREQVYIANILKCRPPGNRDPSADEVDKCLGFLAQQIAWVKPKVILVLGKVAAYNLLKIPKEMALPRGQIFFYGTEKTSALVTYHPAYLLRNGLQKRKVWRDITAIAGIIEKKTNDD